MVRNRITGSRLLVCGAVLGPRSGPGIHIDFTRTRHPSATNKQKAARAKFAATAKSGRGKVGKAAKSTAAPKRKGK